jgi:hypothetical protein
MSPFSGTDVPLVISLNYGQFLFNSGSLFSGQAGSSSNTTVTVISGHDKQWLSRLRDWRAPELKLPKLLRATSSKRSEKGIPREVEITTSKTVSTSESEAVNNLSPPPDTVASIFTANYSTPSERHSSSSPDHGHSTAPSVPREISSIPIPDDSPSVFDPFEFKPSPLPTISERHSSSSSDYGHSYRSRSSSGPSVYHGSDPSFPYPLLYDESLESKPNDHRYLARQSSGSWNSLSPLIPEVNRPPSPECDPSALGIDQSQTHREKEWSSRLFDWKTPGLKLPKLPHPASFKKSEEEMLGVKITISRTISTSEAVNNLPPPPDTVASIFTANYSSTSERPSSSSNCGHSHRSRSSSGPSIYPDSESSFPYPLLYESPESKPNDQERQSPSPRSSIPPPMAELNRLPSADCSADYGPTLGVDQFQSQSNTISEHFVKLGAAAQLLPEPDEKDNDSPMVETKAVHVISTRGPQPEWRESPSFEPRSISWPPPSKFQAFSPKATNAPRLAKIDAVRSRPRKGGVEMPLNPNKKDSGPSTVQTKNLHDIRARRQTAVANPFPFPFTEDSD